MYATFNFIINIMCGLICLKLAVDKGRTKAWFFAGFFLNLLGIIIVFLLRDLYPASDTSSNIAESNRRNVFFRDVTIDDNAETKICSQCIEFNGMTSVCKHYKTDINVNVMECPNYKKEETQTNPVDAT